MPREFTAPQAYTDEARPPIALTPVQSSQVKAIGYDEASKTLAVSFCHGVGAIYHYADVSRETFDAFMASESVGKFFGQHIKPLPFKKFAAEKAAEPTEAPAA